jgi:hypothetical protein
VDSYVLYIAATFVPLNTHTNELGMIYSDTHFKIRYLPFKAEAQIALFKDPVRTEL